MQQLKKKIGSWYFWGMLLSVSVLFVLGQFQRLPGLNLSVYWIDVVIALSTIIFCATHPSKIKRLITHFFQTVLKVAWLRVLCLIIVAGWIVALARGNFSWYTFLYLARYSSYALWGWSVWQQISQNPRRQKPAERILLITGLLLAWFGLLQYFFVPDTRFLAILGWDDHLGRLISTLLDPGFTSLILSYTFFIVILTYYSHLKLKIALLLGLLLSIVLTYSRASYLSLGAGWFTLLALQPSIRYSLMKRKRAVMLLGGIAFGLVLILFVWRPYKGEGTYLARTSTISARLTANQSYLKRLSLDQWILGQGLFVATISPQNQITLLQNGTASIPNHSRFPDNSIVWIITQVGLSGLAVLAVALGWLLGRWRSQPLLLVLLVVTLCHSLFMATLTYNFAWIFLTWTWAVTKRPEPINPKVVTTN